MEVSFLETTYIIVLYIIFLYYFHALHMKDLSLAFLTLCSFILSLHNITIVSRLKFWMNSVQFLLSFSLSNSSVAALSLTTTWLFLI